MYTITDGKHLQASASSSLVFSTRKENRSTSSSNNIRGPNLSISQPCIMPNNSGAHNCDKDPITTRIGSRQTTIMPRVSESEEVKEQPADQHTSSSTYHTATDHSRDSKEQASLLGSLPELVPPPIPPRPSRPPIPPKASNLDAHSNDFHHSRTTRSSAPELAPSGRSGKSWQNAKRVQMQELDRKHDSSSDSDSDSDEEKDGTASNKSDTHLHQLYKQVTEKRFSQSLNEYLDAVDVDLDNFNNRQFFFAKIQRDFPKACKALCDGECGQIVVCGFQSAGKSSLIAALTGAKTQITQGTATKQPIIYQFNNAEVFTAEIKTENGLPFSFKDMASVNKHLAKTQESITGDLCAEILYVSINAPSFICRTLVDLPGDIRDDQDVAEIRDAMYAKFMKPDNVIVRVIPSSTDYQTDPRTYDLLTSGHKFPYKMLVNTNVLVLWKKQLEEGDGCSYSKEGWKHSLFTTGIYTPQKKHEQHKGEVTATPLFAIDAAMPALDKICDRPVEADGDLTAISDVWDELDNDLITKMKAESGASKYRLKPSTIGFTPLNNTLNFIVDKIQSKALKNLHHDLKRQIKECHQKNSEYKNKTAHNLGVLCKLTDFYFSETKFVNKQKLSNSHENLKSDLNKYAYRLLGPVSASIKQKEQTTIKTNNEPKQEKGTINQTRLTGQPAAQSNTRTELDNSDNENAISSAKDEGLQRNITTQDRITFFTETIGPFLEASTVTLAEDNSDIRKNLTIVDMINPVQMSIEKIHTKMFKDAKQCLNQHTQTIIRDTLYDQKLRTDFETIAIGQNQLEKILETSKAKVNEYLEGIMECIKAPSLMIADYKTSHLYLETKNIYNNFCENEFGGNFPKSLSVDALKCFAERNKNKLGFSLGLMACITGTGALAASAPPIALGGGIAAVGATALTGSAARKVVPAVGGGLLKIVGKSFRKAREKDRKRAQLQKTQQEGVRQVVSSVFDVACDRPHTEMAVLFARIEYETSHDLKYLMHQITEPITTNLYSYVAKALHEELRKVYSNRSLKPSACPETPEFYYHENSVLLNQLKEIKSLAKSVR